MQRGIGAIFILIGVALLVGLAALFLGYFSVSKNTKSNLLEKQTVALPAKNFTPPSQPTTTTPGCQDTDYTGCDNTAQWMTWDGTVQQQNNEVKRDSTGTIYSK